MNTQTPEDVVRFNAQALDVNSIFYTIQGEGPNVGKPAVFVRLAGCNLQCRDCDTEYTSRKRMQLPDIIAAIASTLKGIDHDWFPLVVITGGEPFRQPIGYFVTSLLSLGYYVQIETNGTLFQDDFPAPTMKLQIVCSPKTGSVNRLLHRYITAYKYVLTAGAVDPSDGLPIRVLAHPVPKRVARPHPGFGNQVYVQPADDKNETRNKANLREAIKSAMKFNYTLGIQMHKVIDME